MVVKSWLKKVYICNNPFHGVMPIFQFMLSTNGQLPLCNSGCQLRHWCGDNNNVVYHYCLMLG